MRRRVHVIVTALIAAVALCMVWTAVPAQETKPAAEAQPAAEGQPAAEAQPAVSPEADKALPTETDKVSYAIGVNLARNFKRQFVELNPDALARGMADVFGDAKVLLTDEQIDKILSDFQRRAYQNFVEKSAAQSKEFLAKNAKREGVKVTASGLQYEVLQPGTGKTPGPDDKVVVNYRGTLIDGTEFDSSYRRGQPAQFVVGQVIPGWVEALQLMKVGAKWKLFIPPDLAYGMRPPPRSPIPPNAALIFEVELLDIVKNDNAAAAEENSDTAQPAEKPVEEATPADQ